MKKMVYAVEYKSTSKGPIETKRIELGEAVFDEDNSIALSRYDILKKKAFDSLTSYQGRCFKLETADGLVDTFGGYPAKTSEFSRIAFRNKNALKEARLRADLTQKQVTDLLEIPKRTWEDWEAGRRNPPTYVEKLILEKLESLQK